jgi:hypothetical protein
LQIEGIITPKKTQGCKLRELSPPKKTRALNLKTLGFWVFGFLLPPREKHPFLGRLQEGAELPFGLPKFISQGSNAFFTSSSSQSFPIISRIPPEKLQDLETGNIVGHSWHCKAKHRWFELNLHLNHFS